MRVGRRRGSIGRQSRRVAPSAAAAERSHGEGYWNALRERAAALAEEGESWRVVARLVNVAVSAAVHWLRQWTTGSVEAKPGAGHTRLLPKAHEQ